MELLSRFAFNTLRPYTQMIQQGYKELNLIYYFTAGEKEVRCWTLQSGSLVGPTAVSLLAHTVHVHTFTCSSV